MNKKNLQAVLIGATGLVGKEIVQRLLQDDRFQSVQVFARRSTGLSNSKLIEHQVDFRNLNQWKHLIQGDVAFSALGTTRKQAGSLEAQFEVDYTYQAEFASACAQSGIPTFVLISSMGASSESRVPYLKMKGQLEDFIETLGFQHIQILRPGPLQGHREQRRWGEEISISINQWLSKFPLLHDLHPVLGSEVARSAVNSVFLKEALRIHNPQEVRLGV